LKDITPFTCGKSASNRRSDPISPFKSSTVQGSTFRTHRSSPTKKMAAILL
jgi:hypothetical protein